MLSDLQLVYMGPRNSTKLLKINTTKFQVEREPVYYSSVFMAWAPAGEEGRWSPPWKIRTKFLTISGAFFSIWGNPGPFSGAYPGFVRGGNFFFRFGNLPCAALLGGSRAFFLNDAIWCVLVCILIRFCL